MQKKLSIIIPTYNRAGILKKSVWLLINQVRKGNSQDVEIIISDNCSTDDTGLVVQEYISSNSDIAIKYNKNERNLGFDKNCLVGASLSHAKFIWFLSDDDDLKEGAVSEIIENIEKNLDVLFIFLNYNLITPGWAEGTPLFLEENMRVDCDQLMQTTKFGFSCITACVLDRASFMSIDSEKYVGTFWVHLYMIREIASRGESLLIAKPIFVFSRPTLKDSRFSANKNKTTKREFFIDAHINFLSFADSFEAPYSEHTRKYALSSGWRDNLNQILSYKLTIPEYDWEEIKSVIKDMRVYFAWNPSFWIIHIPFLVLPAFFSHSYFFFKLRFVKMKLWFKPYVPRSIWSYYKRKLSF